MAVSTRTPVRNRTPETGLLTGERRDCLGTEGRRRGGAEGTAESAHTHSTSVAGSGTRSSEEVSVAGRVTPQKDGTHTVYGTRSPLPSRDFDSGGDDSGRETGKPGSGILGPVEVAGRVVVARRPGPTVEVHGVGTAPSGVVGAHLLGLGPRPPTRSDHPSTRSTPVRTPTAVGVTRSHPVFRPAGCKYHTGTHSGKGRDIPFSRPGSSKVPETMKDDRR